MTLTTRAAFPLLALVALGACSKKIGDECKTAFDCNQTDETRTCDISQPGGYCIIDGCDHTSCPDEAACVRFFNRLDLPKGCNPAMPDSCGLEEICVAEAADPKVGKCSPKMSESRRCVLRCSEGGDCRGGYECRSTGTYGAVALLGDPAAQVGFCAPSGP